MRSTVRPILICLLLGASGCACQPLLGEPVDDAARQAALLRLCRRPSVHEAVFRTLISWPGREVSVTEVVKIPADGGFSVAGVTDIGSTLYAVRVAPDASGHVISKSLPFSDRWLLDNLVAELLIPWNGPTEAWRLFRQSDRTWTLVREVQNDIHVFSFDASGYWQGFRRFSGGRLHSRVSLEWDTESIPKVMRVDNPSNHYHIVRERISIR